MQCINDFKEGYRAGIEMVDIANQIRDEKLDRWEYFRRASNQYDVFYKNTITFIGGTCGLFSKPLRLLKAFPYI